MLQFPESSGAKVAIYNANGQVLKQLVPASGVSQTRLDISLLAPGNYFVQYTSLAGKTNVERFVKGG